MISSYFAVYRENETYFIKCDFVICYSSELGNNQVFLKISRKRKRVKSCTIGTISFHVIRALVHMHGLYFVFCHSILYLGTHLQSKFLLAFS